MIFKRITIIGLGLIGGSLGLAIKKHRIAKEVVGISRRNKTLNRALKIGAADRVTLDLSTGVRDADLIILAVPILKIPTIIKKIKGDLKKGSIIIDVASTKDFIAKDIRKALPKDVSYIGCHPMAGSEKKGIEFSKIGLFKKNYCILTRTKDTKKAPLFKIRRFWQGLGMRVVIMSPERHDSLVSGLSHLPHGIAATLMNSLSGLDLRFGSGGLRDTTRISASDPDIWVDIFLTNRENILKDIENFEKNLSALKGAIKSSDRERLFKFFAKAKALRGTIKPY